MIASILFMSQIATSLPHCLWSFNETFHFWMMYPGISSSHRHSVPIFFFFFKYSTPHFTKSYKRLCQSIIEMRIEINIHLIERAMNKRVQFYVFFIHAIHHRRLNAAHTISLRIVLFSQKKISNDVLHLERRQMEKRLISLHSNNLVRVPDNFALCIFAFHI